MVNTVQDIGSGTDVWKFSEAVRSGKMSMTNFLQAESGMSRSRGTCMTMGTANNGESDGRTRSSCPTMLLFLRSMPGVKPWHT